MPARRIIVPCQSNAPTDEPASRKSADRAVPGRLVAGRAQACRFAGAPQPHRPARNRICPAVRPRAERWRTRLPGASSGPADIGFAVVRPRPAHRQSARPSHDGQRRAQDLSGRGTGLAAGRRVDRTLSTNTTY